MSRARAHHYVPQTYLRNWAENGRVSVRRRESQKAFVAATSKVAQETDLYTVDTDDGPSDWVEKELSKFEALLPDMLSTLGSGKVPRRGTNGREQMAALLALQYVRTPDRMELYTLPYTALALAAGANPVPKEVISQLLEGHGGYAPTDSEVQGAWDYVNYVLVEGKRLSRFEYLDIQFRALPDVASHLMALSWSVESTKGARTFLTSDQPLQLWVQQPTPWKGVGPVGADEIRFPVDPRHLLVLRPRGGERSGLVTRSRVAAVNQHAAATCRHMIIGRPCDENQLGGLTMRPKRPMFKFNEGPLYRGGADGDEYQGEVLHFYRPYDDRDLDEY